MQVLIQMTDDNYDKFEKGQLSLEAIGGMVINGAHFKSGTTNGEFIIRTCNVDDILRLDNGDVLVYFKRPKVDAIFTAEWWDGIREEYV